MKTSKTRSRNNYGAFPVALAFFSRLAPAANTGSPAIFWHGAAGLAIGVCAALPPLLLLPLLWPAPSASFILGWFWLGLEVWISRGLHWDAVADLGDALGSGQNGPPFRAILKDSRLGAFGAMCLILGMTGQALAAAGHFYAIGGGSLAPLTALVLAPAWARLAPAWLAYKSVPYAIPSLGASICQHINRRLWLWAWAQAAIIIALCLTARASLASISALLLAQIVLNCWFSRLGRRFGGVSGDFFGAHIEASQLLFLLFTVG